MMPACLLPADGRVALNKQKDMGTLELKGSVLVQADCHVSCIACYPPKDAHWPHVNAHFWRTRRFLAYFPFLAFLRHFLSDMVLRQAGA